MKLPLITVDFPLSLGVVESRSALPELGHGVDEVLAGVRAAGVSLEKCNSFKE